MRDAAMAQVPPQNLEAERSVLGSMMVSAPAVGDVIDSGLQVEDFYRERHRLVYEVLLELWERSADPATNSLVVCDHLERTGRLEEAGGRAEVVSLADQVPAPGNARHYAAIVRQHAKLRRLLATAQEIQARVHGRDGTPEELLDQAERSLFAIEEGASNVELRGLGEGLDTLMDEVERRLAGEDVGRLLGTGFADLDTKLGGGLGEGWLVTVAGRPSMGKSSFALALADNVAKAGRATAVFSTEMSYDEVVRRIAYARAGVSGTKVNAGEITREEARRLLRSANALEKLPIVVDETSSLTARHIRARCRRYRARGATELGLVVVDYLQLMDAERRSREPNRVQELGEITTQMKQLARELACPVVILSQLNRKVEERINKRPVLADLRDSGRIEEDSDLVVFLYRDEYYDAETEEVGVAEANVAKNRHGPTGMVKLSFSSEFARFRDLAPAA